MSDRDIIPRRSWRRTRIEDFSSWKMLRPLCFSPDKRKKLPGSFHIVLSLGPRDVEKFCSFPGHGNRWQPDSGIVSEYPLRRRSIILYNGNFAELFTLDKTLENEWDNAVKRLYIVPNGDCVHLR